MANTGEHYCHSVKTHDANSEATYLDCHWIGRRDQLVHNIDKLGFEVAVKLAKDYRENRLIALYENSFDYKGFSFREEKGELNGKCHH